MNFAEHARLEARGEGNVVFEGVRVEGDLAGQLLTLAVEQRFRNPGKTHLEVVYSFPLPHGGTLLGVEVLLGDKRLSGAVAARSVAEAKYEAALSEGDAAIMLERTHDGGYCLNLGNLAPEETCVITLRYAQVLAFEQGGLRVTVPTVIAPRYGDAVADGGFKPHQAPVTDLTARYGFDCTLRLHGALARAKVASPSHPIGVTGGTETLVVSLARAAALDRDFVLTVEGLTQASMLVAGEDALLPEHRVVLAGFCPRIPAAGSPEVAVKMLVDCSGSMAGDSIAAARRALMNIVTNFREGDRFSLSRFGSTVEHRSRALWSATERTRLAAQRWIGELDATLGGTEMEGALASTFALAQDCKSDVLLLTDGEIYGIDATVAAARASGHRVNVVGIGASPSQSLLYQLAQSTGGFCEFVAPGEAVEAAVLRMFARLRSPRVSEVRLVWPQGASPLWHTPVSASIFDGDTVSVFAAVPRGARGDVKLQGRRADGELLTLGSVSLEAAPLAGDTLARVAASRRIEAAQLSGEEAGIDAAALAVAYQLVTEHTNFILVHQRAAADKAGDMPDLHTVAQMLPAGWGGTSTALECGSAVDVMSFDLAAPAPACAKSMPAMLRKRAASAGHYAPPGAPLAEPLQEEKEYARMAEPHYQGLTPLGYSQLLRDTAPANWPASYAALRACGLGAAVVDWLEFVLAGDADEATAVACFNWVLAHAETAAAFHAAVANALRALVARITGSPRSPGGAEAPDAALAERIATAMGEAAASEWPAAAFALDVV